MWTRLLAAALLLGEGHEVVGATMKLWGGVGDSGCCSVGDVEDARHVAARLGIDHHVFNFTEEFEEMVVAPYAEAHARGHTPNPCIECNRHLKFRRFLDRRSGSVLMPSPPVTTPEWQVTRERPLPTAPRPRPRQGPVLRAVDADRGDLARVLLPVGEMTKPEVRELAATLDLPTAAKPDSQEVCFVAAGAGQGPRQRFLAERIEPHPGRLVDRATGAVVGSVPAVELVTVGQRRGLGLSAEGRVRSRGRRRLRHRRRWRGGRPPHRSSGADRAHLVSEPLAPGSRTGPSSAHGRARQVRLTETGVAYLDGPDRRVAPGQTVALYMGDEVVGSGTAA